MNARMPIIRSGAVSPSARATPMIVPVMILGVLMILVLLPDVVFSRSAHPWPSDPEPVAAAAEHH